LALLLDTNVILFGLLQPNKIQPSLRARLIDKNERVCASVASVYEIGFKVLVGKLVLPSNFDILAHLRSADVELVTIKPEHALRASQLPLVIRDPWDRIIVAQALCEGLSLVSSDSDIASLGIDPIW
jgi:PIN domain nuclease of toxin-antitoxin system